MKGLCRLNGCPECIDPSDRKSADLRMTKPKKLQLSYPAPNKKGLTHLARQVEDAFQVVGLGKKIYQVSLLDAVSEVE